MNTPRTSKAPQRSGAIDGAVASGLAYSTWQKNLRGQWLYAVAISVILVAFPYFGDNRATVAGLVMVVATVQVAVIGWFARTQPQALAVIPMMDQVLVAIVGGLIPATFQWGVVITAVTVAASPAIYGQRVTRVSIAVGGILYLIVGLIAEPPNWQLSVTVFLLTTIATGELVGKVSSEERRVRARYGDIIDGLNVIVVEAPDIRQPLSFVSEQVCEVLGFDVETWKCQGHWNRRTHDNDRDKWFATLNGLAPGESAQCTVRILAEDGTWVHLLAQVRHGAEGLRGIMMDVSGKQRAVGELNALGNFLKQLPTPLEVLRVRTDADTGVPSVEFVAGSEAAVKAIGLAAEHADAWLTESRFVDAWPEHLAAYARVVETGVPMTPSQVQWVNHDGDERTIVVSAFPLARGHVGVLCEDITEREHAASELRRQANEDVLTGLANRARFSSELDAILDAPGTPQGAVLLMDLDQFKEVNDALGHHHGDRLLIELAERLRHFESDDVVTARLGGDEFAVIMNGATARDAFQLAARIRELFAKPIVVDGISLQTNVSIGVATYPEHAADADGLLQRADAAMYQAKNGGTGITLHQEDQASDGVRRLQILSDLRPAINTGQLLLHYQPKVSFETGEVEGLEALVRWQHPTLGMLPPDEFIHLAEVSGLIQDLTLFVIRAAVADAAHLRRAGHDLPVAVNLSARNLYYPRIHDVVLDSLAYNELPTKNLRIELTESELMEDPKIAMQVLQRLRNHGIQVSIDDFGTGYSSLSYLRDLPIDEIKIDRSFVADITGGDDVVVRSIIDLGHALGVDVSAEGVETQQQWHHLRRLGCDVAQGYLISRPLGFDALTRFLDDRRTFGVPEWIGATGNSRPAAAGSVDALNPASRPR
ncbi:MAG: EAL domain-containing protein [Actinobacteria bacterium]|nr:EAL domain-containing protein [Actinomycetota bacterium]